MAWSDAARAAAPEMRRRKAAGKKWRLRPHLTSFDAGILRLLRETDDELPATKIHFALKGDPDAYSKALKKMVKAGRLEATKRTHLKGSNWLAGRHPVTRLFYRIKK
jgi:hypothetical protein